MNSDIFACEVCPRLCRIAEGGTGFCGARGVLINPDTGEKSVVSINYGKLTSIALDPVEKKPLRHFHPGKMILSVGSFGCNLICPWCQNHNISRAKENDVGVQELKPAELAVLAEKYAAAGSIGVAFTYNEPLVGYEYAKDTSQILKERGLKSVLVTNGYMNTSLFLEMLPFIDAMNIDLKSVREDFYKKIGGRLDVVKENIKSAARRCHIEITCLLINGENDSEAEMEEMADFIASISSEIPFHISRFFPRYRMTEHEETDIESMEKFKKIVKGKLKYVYLGNI